eukprot:COSAG05_NODE_349_length_10936_cov_9.714404_12_plen_75_part_00
MMGYCIARAVTTVVITCPLVTRVAYHREALLWVQPASHIASQPAAQPGCADEAGYVSGILGSLKLSDACCLAKR